MTGAALTLLGGELMRRGVTGHSLACDAFGAHALRDEGNFIERGDTVTLSGDRL